MWTLPKMSNFFKNNFGSSSSSIIYVHLTKSRYTSGDYLEGTVSLSVREQTHVDGIFLKFKGFEETRLIEVRTQSHTVNGQTQTTTYSVPHHQKKHLFRRHVDLLNMKATLNPGLYVYPFRFKLDDNLPGSFIYKKSNNYLGSGLTLGGDNSAFGRIVYKLKAEVVRPGMFRSNIKNTTIIPIITRMPGTIQKIQAAREATVTRLCFIDMGNIRCSAILDKNAYSPGEVAHLVLCVDNTSSDVSLKHISFKLTNSLQMRAGSFTHSFKETACKNQAPGVPKGDTAHIDITVDLPRYLNPTTAGSLITSFYYLEIVMSVPCSKDIVMSLPVTIFDEIPAGYVENVQYPADRPPNYQQVVDIRPEMFRIY